VLHRFAASGDPDPANVRADSGPIVLAALAARGSGGRVGAGLRARVVERWLESLHELLRCGSIEFGPSGPWSALAIAASLDSRLGRLNRSLWQQVADELPDDLWRSRDVRWADYDVIRGPAGMLLSLVASGRLGTSRASRSDPEPARRRLAGRCARHLLELCEDAELSSLRLGRDHADERLRWGEGRVNTGLAHGVAGVALALTSALEHGFAPASRVAPALARVSQGLVAASCLDRDGMRSWPLALPGELPPSSSPQAWCYGTPGIAWSLWESGRALGRRDVSAFALDAMRSWCRRFEPEVDPLVDAASQLGFCHGVAGMVAIADAFARHARLDAAARLAAELEALLRRRLDAIVALPDASLLTGAPGILAVLLTRDGAPRRWLLPFGLR